MKVFISYYSDEEADAEDITNHLEATFHKYNLKVFMASRWDSIAPGDDWENKIINAVNEANLLLVLMSFDALTRPWINFEIGVAWAKSTPILFLCHNGMDPNALPRPYGSLQAINLNGKTHEDKLKQICDAVSRVLGIEAVECDKIPDLSLFEPIETFFSVNRRWHLLPASHINETSAGLFLVGGVRPSDPDRAKLAGMTSGETLHVRLFFGRTPEGRYINAMVSGEMAKFFERVGSDTRIVAKIRFAAVLQEGEKTTPLLVVDDFREITSKDEQDQPLKITEKLLESIFVVNNQ
jgi:hypothetical protein